MTDASGKYSFTGLTPGSYKVREVVSAGYVQTFPKSVSHTVAILPSDFLSGLDFGNALNRRFDFNTATSTTETGFLGVKPTDLYGPSAGGYGWNAQTSSVDRGTGSIPSSANLYRNLHYSSAGSSGARTFSVLVGPNVTVTVRAHFRDTFSRDRIDFYNVDNTTQGVFNLSVSANTSVTRTFTATGGSDGVIELTIRDNGGDPYWVISGIEVGFVLPLDADAGPAPLPAGTMLLSDASLTPIVQQAINAWSAAGLSAGQVAALGTARVQVTDLAPWGPNYLGLAGPGFVWIDDDAAGLGWFVDPTPADSNEFAGEVNPSEYVAALDSSAAGRIDLLTVALHEFGHVLGLDHGDANGVMGESLPTGVRRLLEEESHAGDHVPEAAPLQTESSLENPAGDATRPKPIVVTPAQRPADHSEAAALSRDLFSALFESDPSLLSRDPASVENRMAADLHDGFTIARLGQEEESDGDTAETGDLLELLLEEETLDSLGS